jgi:hypothetical protein
MFFFEKKNQKTFAPCGLAVASGLGAICKSFLLLFFKKEASCFLAAAATSTRKSHQGQPCCLGNDTRRPPGLFR